MSDVCIENDGIMHLEPVPSALFGSESKERMFGVWTHIDGSSETFEWRYDNVILIYTKKGNALSFKAEDILMDGDCATSGYEPSYTPRSRHPAA